MSSAVCDDTIGLTDMQVEFQSMAKDFAENELFPHAADWDTNHTFPVETLRKAAGLGFGGVFVKEDVGGSGLGRVDGAVIFEALSSGCTSTTAYVARGVLWVVCIGRIRYPSRGGGGGGGGGLGGGRRGSLPATYGVDSHIVDSHTGLSPGMCMFSLSPHSPQVPDHPQHVRLDDRFIRHRGAARAPPPIPRHTRAL